MSETLNRITEKQFDEKYSEIFKLHDMLKTADIPHDFHRRMMGGRLYVYQILYPNKESWDCMLPGEGARDMTCSIIEGPDTRGGDQNRLEIYGLFHGTDPDFDSLVGYLTAENVYNEIVKAEEERKAMFTHMPKDAMAEEE